MRPAPARRGWRRGMRWRRSGTCAPWATVAGYLPIRSEIDPRPAMLALVGLGYRVGVPVIEGARAAAGVPGLDAGRGDRARARSGSRCRWRASRSSPTCCWCRCWPSTGAGTGWATAAGSTTARSRALRARREVHALGFAYAGAGGAGGAGRRDRHAARRDRDRGGGPLAGVSGACRRPGSRLSGAP